jgi:hypothetical protein
MQAVMTQGNLAAQSPALDKAANLNRWAAIWTALAVVSGAISNLLGLWPICPCHH